MPKSVNLEARRRPGSHGCWKFTVTEADDHVNLQNLKPSDPVLQGVDQDVRDVIQKSKSRFLTDKELYLLFLAAANGKLPVSPIKPKIGRQGRSGGLYFVLCYQYSDGRSIRFRKTKDRNRVKSSKGTEDFNYTECELWTKGNPYRSKLLLTRRNLRIKHEFDKLTLIHYLLGKKKKTITDTEFDACVSGSSEEGSPGGIPSSSAAVL